MRAVDYRGDRYLLLKQSDESSLVRDPETGDERYLPNDELTATGDSPLTVAARTVPDPQRRLLGAVHSEQILGLLVELSDRGPLSVRELLGRYDLCESDLHGRVGELRAAGLVREADVAGERGYGTTELAEEALSALR
ncbi:HTH domain protein [Natronomonas moolapensis 8.8.11]|uniref:HTH domain protein n=1 Tax=Natronomonas moolapensis (strain DSM 18674 / CECT 7526 / JCM 14361 / 8.8.11) TaxID=268739 RepID=M1XPC6_NATM8|nr:hypothetical protein [Natronomonas moolapensis]CCQ35893.1 HTH domain protein [Natronomonas moolapensis 8.8.11]